MIGGILGPAACWYSPVMRDKSVGVAGSGRQVFQRGGRLAFRIFLASVQHRQPTALASISSTSLVATAAQALDHELRARRMPMRSDRYEP
jgi:hypothetical protein